jgi:hypothetical protein
MFLKLKMVEGTLLEGHFENDISAASAIAPVRSTFGDVFFPP